MSKIDIPSAVSPDITPDAAVHSLHEKVSSMVDGELSNQEYAGMIAEIGNGNGAASWDQYHLIGEAMRKNLPDTIYPDLSTRISAAIASEAAHQNEPLSQPTSDEKVAVTNTVPAVSQVKSPVLGYAIAASISAVAITGLFQLNQQSQSTQPAAQMFVSQPPQITKVPLLSEISWSHEVKQEPVQPRYPLSPIPNEKLYRYIVNHNEHSVAMPAQGAMLPYARLVGYESTQ